MGEEKVEKLGDMWMTRMSTTTHRQKRNLSGASNKTVSTHTECEAVQCEIQTH